VFVLENSPPRFFRTTLDPLCADLTSEHRLAFETSLSKSQFKILVKALIEGQVQILFTVVRTQVGVGSSKGGLQFPQIADSRRELLQILVVVAKQVFLSSPWIDKGSNDVPHHVENSWWSNQVDSCEPLGIVIG